MHDRFPRPIVAWWGPPRNGPQNSNLQSIIPCTLRLAYSYPPKTNLCYVLDTFSVASARLRHSEAPLRCQCAPRVDQDQRVQNVHKQQLMDILDALILIYPGSALTAQGRFRVT